MKEKFTTENTERHGKKSSVNEVRAQYTPYPKYKSSRVAWIGDIPEHWEVRKNKFTNFVKMGQSPDNDKVNQNNIGIPFLQGNAEFGKINPINVNWCIEPKKVCNRDDILLSVRAPIGEINIADQSYCIGRGLCAITAIKHTRDYLFYTLQTVKQELKSLGVGSTFTAISNKDSGNIEIPLPPLAEQKAIAAFLDRETANIDALIGKIEKQMELLHEYKQSIITHAVTGKIDARGL